MYVVVYSKLNGKLDLAGTL